MSDSISKVPSDSSSRFPPEETAELAAAAESPPSPFADSAKIFEQGSAQQFVAAKAWGVKDDYSTAAELPLLLQPDPDGATGPQPLESSEQKAIKRLLAEKIAKKMLEKGEKAPSDATRKEAAEEVRKTWNLPVTWTPESTKKEDWTVQGVLKVSQGEIDTARKAFIIENVTTTLTHLEGVLQSRAIEFPQEEGTNVLTSQDILRFVQQTIRDFKEVLNILTVKTGEAQKQALKAKFDEIELRFKKLEEDLKLALEAEAEREKAAKMGKIMKILGPVISAIVTIVAVAATVLTAGAASPLLIAAAVVSTAMFAYSIADSQLNLTSKCMEAINSALDGIDSPLLKALAKAAIVIAVIVVVVVVIAATGGSAAASVSAQVASQVTKQLLITLTIMFVMSSNVIGELITGSLIESGAVSKNDAETLMIINMVVTAVCVIASIVICSKMMGGATNAAASKAQSVAERLKEFADNLKKALTEALQNLSNVSITVDKIKNLANLPREALENLIKGVQAFKGMDMATLPGKLQIAFTTIEHGTQVASNIYLATIGFKVADILFKLGDVKEATAVIQAIIDMLEALAKMLQESMAQDTGMIGSLSDMLDSMIQSRKRSVHTLLSA